MDVKGLILLGGQSTRMKQPKHLIEYHDQPQYLFLHSLLSTVCSEVYLSLNTEQSFYTNQIISIPDHPLYAQHGPISGIISAMAKLESTLFVLPCDCPYINHKTIEHLFYKRNPESIATVYHNQESGITEPLIGIYEKHGLPQLIHWFEQGNYSLRHFLDSQPTTFVTPLSNSELISANTPEEMEQAMLFLRSMR